MPARAAPLDGVSDTDQPHGARWRTVGAPARGVSITVSNASEKRSRLGRLWCGTVAVVWVD
ncbi:hypothetical protein [Haladaptatus sp. R4]|uniref:hypothetical protein n=1 Tax=Haladaptatus sp. R4 TaxID=1679489 RepID=UPI00123714C8|nr:hypothetical protein [Haladaptatus sp. R4]